MAGRPGESPGPNGTSVAPLIPGLNGTRAPEIEGGPQTCEQAHTIEKGRSIPRPTEVIMAKNGREPGMPREDRQSPDQLEKDTNEDEGGRGDREEIRRGEQEDEQGPDQKDE
jgi:hypothetical protein